MTLLVYDRYVFFHGCLPLFHRCCNI
jgi:hypothetical protein